VVVETTLERKLNNREQHIRLEGDAEENLIIPPSTGATLFWTEIWIRWRNDKALVVCG
jgi:hypothetical protein